MEPVVVVVTFDVGTGMLVDVGIIFVVAIAVIALEFDVTASYAVVVPAGLRVEVVIDIDVLIDV